MLSTKSSALILLIIFLAIGSEVLAKDVLETPCETIHEEEKKLPKGSKVV